MNELCKKLNLGKILKIEKFNSSQNNVYKVVTIDNTYVIKEYSKDAIKNNYCLNKRKEQIKISKILSDNNIPCSFPLTFNNKYFIKLKDHYYLIYDYIEEETLSRDCLKINHIKMLAKTQAKIHKINISTNIPCSYKKTKIDLKKHLKKINNIDKELYDTIKNNLNILTDIITKSNEHINEMKKNLCVSHNDYKLLNILWSKNQIRLIDFDATGRSNPTCCLAESSFTFANFKTYINFDFYKTYLEEYLKEYGEIKEDYKNAIYVSFNGKLNWLSYMMSKNTKKKNNYINETMEMINELVLYYNNIDNFVNIYNKVSKNVFNKK